LKYILYESPGAVKTEFFNISKNATKAKLDDLLEGLAKKYHLGPVGEPLDVAKAVLYLTSDDASFVTGSNFVVDGGAQYV
jgi:3alpha(or 20beta)-hydroxysteroid dehydrogenase